MCMVGSTHTATCSAIFNILSYDCSELDENSEDERKKKAAAAGQQAAFVDMQSMDDEVERVLSHRCAPADPNQKLKLPTQTI